MKQRKKQLTVPEFIAMFDKVVTGPGPDDFCEVWRGAVRDVRCYRGGGSTVHGTVYWNGRLEYAHRVKYAIDSGLDIRDLKYPEHVVCHGPCENGLCGRTSHIRLGTVKDNVQDMIRRGRRPNRLAPRTLTADKVLGIKHDHRDGMTQVAIARKYGVSSTHICNILAGRFWPHVKLEEETAA